MSNPGLGAYGVVRTNGWVGRAIRMITDSPVNHAAVYVGDGKVVEAQPHGAQMADVDPNMIWSPEPDNGFHVATEALKLLGTPYSFLDVVCIGLAKIFGWQVPGAVRHRLARAVPPHIDRLMCSQLVDTAYLNAGIHLFQDGRIPGDVSPGDLYDLLPNHIQG